MMVKFVMAHFMYVYSDFLSHLQQDSGIFF